MSDYKSIIGKPLKFVTANLDNAQAEGQIWYNSTTGEFKDLIVNEAWSSGGNVTTARPAAGGFGIQTAAVMYGGGPSSKGDLTEEYNGTGFSTGGTLNSSRSTCQDNGWGVDSAGICASGNTPGGNTANVEEYNGSSWTEVNNVSTARRQQASIGLVQTAGAICGGFSTANTDATEEYDGTNWTSGGTLNTSRRGFTGAGTLTAGIVYSGVTTAITTAAEEYDGTSWTTSPSINTARNNGAGSTNAPQSTALLFGGNTGSDTGKTEKYDGTTWTETADMATARDAQSGSGTGTAALTAAGKTSGDVTNTEEFTRSLNVITGAAWASGGALNTGGQNGGGAGIQTAALAYGGDTGRQAPGTTEAYDGSSWTNTPATLNTKRYNGHGFGSQSAAVALGGISYPPLGVHNVTEEYDGSSWTNATAQPAFSYQNGTAGSLTAGVVFGGNGTAPGESVLSTTNEYDGTNWTSGGALNNARSSTTQGGAGTQTACLCAGTRAGSPINPSALVEEYNGTSWTAGGALNAAKTMGGMAGVQTNALLYGGGPTTDLALSSENYNGTSWVTSASMASPRSSCMPATQATADTSLAVGSSVAPTYAQTEEFSAGTSVLNVKTISTS